MTKNALLKNAQPQEGQFHHREQPLSLEQLWGYRRAIARRWSHLGSAISFLSILFWLQLNLFCMPAQAESWVMVAKSDATQEQQYVDADSIESLGSIVRLKTYWGFLGQPDSIHYATTEYRCQTEEYRDVKVDGQSTKAQWQSLEGDPLNSAAMTYGCKHREID